MNEIGPNFIARPYRGVSVQDVDSLEPDALRRAPARPPRLPAHGVHRRGARRRARARPGRARGRRRDPRAGPRRAGAGAGPRRSRSSRDPAIDTGNASAAGARRGRRARGSRVVEGRFQHVNFIYEPAPLPIRVVEVVPPHPPKLLDMARTVLDYDEDLPPVGVRLRADRPARAGRRRAEHYLFPCRCAGLELDARVDFLDAGPPRRRRLDARRLRALAPDPRRALRPRAARADRLLPAADRAERTQLTLLKCCLRERGIERSGARMTVPWGASLEEVRAALRELRGMNRLGDLRPPVGAPTRPARCSATRARTRTWLEILAALAAAQGELGIIPAPAAAELTARRPRARPRGGRRADPRHRPLDARADPRRCARSSGPRAPSGSTTARRSRTSPTPGSGW